MGQTDLIGVHSTIEQLIQRGTRVAAEQRETYMVLQTLMRESRIRKQTYALHAAHNSGNHGYPDLREDI